MYHHDMHRRSSHGATLTLTLTLTLFVCFNVIEQNVGRNRQISHVEAVWSAPSNRSIFIFKPIPLTVLRHDRVVGNELELEHGNNGDSIRIFSLISFTRLFLMLLNEGPKFQIFHPDHLSMKAHHV